MVKFRMFAFYTFFYSTLTLIVFYEDELNFNLGDLTPLETHCSGNVLVLSRFLSRAQPDSTRHLWSTVVVGGLWSVVSV